MVAGVTFPPESLKKEGKKFLRENCCGSQRFGMCLRGQVARGGRDEGGGGEGGEGIFTCTLLRDII